jgi:hypothetical protein
VPGLLSKQSPSKYNYTTIEKKMEQCRFELHSQIDQDSNHNVTIAHKVIMADNYLAMTSSMYHSQPSDWSIVDMSVCYSVCHFNDHARYTLRAEAMLTFSFFQKSIRLN